MFDFSKKIFVMSFFFKLSIVYIVYFQTFHKINCSISQQKGALTSFHLYQKNLHLCAKYNFLSYFVRVKFLFRETKRVDLILARNLVYTCLLIIEDKKKKKKVLSPEKWMSCLEYIISVLCFVDCPHSHHRDISA